MVNTTKVYSGNKHSTCTYDVELKWELMLDNDIRDILQWLLFSITCQLIDIFGVTTNIINIVCFIKQGFKDPVNVSLLGLAVSDLGCLTTLIWTNICLTPAVAEADLPFDALEFQYLTSAWPHATFSRITSWITALITLERCLCITVPLKVKHIVTPKRVCVVIVIINIALLSTMAPMYVVNRLEWKYYPDRNKTLIGLVVTEDRAVVETVSFAINNVFIPNTAFLIIFVCTITLVVNLRAHRKWQKTSTSHIKETALIRNQKVAKMVVMISGLFISCFIPFSIIFVGALLEPDLAVDGKYKNVSIILIGAGMVLESINSSVNIFIYYNMSSKYKSTFRQLFRKLYPTEDYVKETATSTAISQNVYS